VLGKPRSYIYAHPENKLTPEQEQQYNTLLQRYNAGEPMAYILGKKEFWSLELDVNPNVLIPRPETELLVELALEYEGDDLHIVDLGTGSGAIALAIASERPTWNITATDNNPNALNVAQKNAQKFNLNNIKFIHSNWCDSLPDNTFDIIISNPPYVAADDPYFEPNNYEPKTALIAANNGLHDIKKIIIQSKTKLKPNGILMLEHGFQQGKMVRQLLRDCGYDNVATYNDLAGLERVTLTLPKSLPKSLPNAQKARAMEGLTNNYDPCFL
jgi:release factor glutamine methyltransferase